MATRVLIPALLVPAILISEDMWLKGMYPTLYSANSEYGFSKAYALVLLINVFACSIYTLISGFAVGSARRRIMEEAQDAGDKDAEARFMLPKMQAEGFSAAARKFNVEQRCHYQILESFQIWLVTSIIGGWEYPMTCSLFGAIWIKARMDWAAGYRRGGPSNRFNVGLGPWVWVCFHAPLLALAFQGCKVLFN